MAETDWRMKPMFLSKSSQFISQESFTNFDQNFVNQFPRQNGRVEFGLTITTAIRFFDP
jgi:hypothetical protein